MLAARMGVSRTIAHRVLRRHDVQLHRVWSASNCPTIPNLKEKVRDIVDLYLNPPDRALVLCLDALDRTAPERKDGADEFVAVSPPI